MPRVTNAPASRRRRKRFIERAKGYRGGRRRLMKSARQAVEHAGQYAYRDRKSRKRDFRKLWIARISAGARLFGMSYSRFMQGLSLADVHLNRKVLADIAVMDRAQFQRLVELAKARQEAGT